MMIGHKKCEVVPYIAIDSQNYPVLAEFGIDISYNEAALEIRMAWCLFAYTKILTIMCLS